MSDRKLPDEFYARSPLSIDPEVGMHGESYEAGARDMLAVVLDMIVEYGAATGYYPSAAQLLRHLGGDRG